MLTEEIAKYIASLCFPDPIPTDKKQLEKCYRSFAALTLLIFEEEPLVTFEDIFQIANSSNFAKYKDYFDIIYEILAGVLSEAQLATLISNLLTLQLKTDLARDPETALRSNSFAIYLLSAQTRQLIKDWATLYLAPTIIELKQIIQENKISQLLNFKEVLQDIEHPIFQKLQQLIEKLLNILSDKKVLLALPKLMQLNIKAMNEVLVIRQRDAKAKQGDDQLDFAMAFEFEKQKRYERASFITQSYLFLRVITNYFSNSISQEEHGTIFRELIIKIICNSLNGFARNIQAQETSEVDKYMIFYNQLRDSFKKNAESFVNSLITDIAAPDNQLELNPHRTVFGKRPKSKKSAIVQIRTVLISHRRKTIQFIDPAQEASDLQIAAKQENLAAVASILQSYKNDGMTISITEQPTTLFVSILPTILALYESTKPNIELTQQAIAVLNPLMNPSLTQEELNLYRTEEKFYSILQQLLVSVQTKPYQIMTLLDFNKDIFFKVVGFILSYSKMELRKDDIETLTDISNEIRSFLYSCYFIRAGLSMNEESLLEFSVKMYDYFLQAIDYDLDLLTKVLARGLQITQNKQAQINFTTNTEQILCFKQFDLAKTFDDYANSDAPPEVIISKWIARIKSISLAIYSTGNAEHLFNTAQVNVEHINRELQKYNESNGDAEKLQTELLKKELALAQQHKQYRTKVLAVYNAKLALQKAIDDAEKIQKELLPKGMSTSSIKTNDSFGPLIQALKIDMERKLIDLNKYYNPFKSEIATILCQLINGFLQEFGVENNKELSTIGDCHMRASPLMLGKPVFNNESSRVTTISTTAATTNTGSDLRSPRRQGLNSGSTPRLAQKIKSAPPPTQPTAELLAASFVAGGLISTVVPASGNDSTSSDSSTNLYASAQSSSLG